MANEDEVPQEKMEAGEIEMRKAFEEVATRNINAILLYTKETRKKFRELEEKVGNQEAKMREQDNTIKDLQQQLAVAKGAIYAGGSEA